MATDMIDTRLTTSFGQVTLVKFDYGDIPARDASALYELSKKSSSVEAKREVLKPAEKGRARYQATGQADRPETRRTARARRTFY